MSQAVVVNQVREEEPEDLSGEILEDDKTETEPVHLSANNSMAITNKVPVVNKDGLNDKRTAVDA